MEVRRGKRQVALGVVISANGQILTKLSELRPVPGTSAQLASSTSESSGSRLTCLLPGGKLLEAQIIAEDEETDLALLKVEAEGLKAPDWARDFQPRLGQWLVTPTTGGAVTTIGIVSAQKREIPAQRVFGVLGVQLDEGGASARIREVFEDSGAKAAGLQVGDLITKCDDREIATGQGLIARLRQKKPGEEVILQIRRDGEAQTIKVTLTHPFGVFLSQFAQQNRMGTELSSRADGFTDVFSQDGDVDPEECGGPVLNLDGRIVGINIARAGRIETLVLPVDVVEKAIERLQAKAPRPAATEVSTDGVKN